MPLAFAEIGTGGMGEVITRDARGNKLMVRKVERVPLDLMAAIQRGDLRGTEGFGGYVLAGAFGHVFAICFKHGRAPLRYVG